MENYKKHKYFSLYCVAVNSFNWFGFFIIFYRITDRSNYIMMMMCGDMRD